jgi:hypothetical protein
MPLDRRLSDAIRRIAAGATARQRLPVPVG